MTVATDKNLFPSSADWHLNSDSLSDGWNMEGRTAELGQVGTTTGGARAAESERFRLSRNSFLPSSLPPTDLCHLNSHVPLSLPRRKSQRGADFEEEEEKEDVVESIDARQNFLPFPLFPLTVGLPPSPHLQ